MNPGLIALAVVIGVGVLLASRSVRIVRPQQAVVVERSGEYSRTLEPGRHFLIPVVEKVKPPIDLREQRLTLHESTNTKDHASVEVTAVVHFQVVEPRAAVYETPNYITAVERLAIATVSKLIAATDLEAARVHRREIGGELRGVLDNAADAWGIRVNRAELVEIKRIKALFRRHEP